MNDEIDTTVPDDPAGNQLADNKSHAVANLKVVAGELDDEFHGMVFQDSDVYKWLEEAAYALAYHPDPELKALCDRTVNLIARAQQPDGYLDTLYQVKSGVWADRPRFSLIQQSHEMYVTGHYIEAAVAYHQVSGNEQALEVAKKMADCLDANFGPEEGKIHGADGHAVRVGYLCTGVTHVGSGADRHRQAFLEEHRHPSYVCHRCNRFHPRGRVVHLRLRSAERHDVR